ncbi:MAG TPA: flippase-like domain-containing protein [Terriglobales bacterium]|nr:flippase-like domain-containing protein [Terriglobales bacterium]
MRNSAPRAKRHLRILALCLGITLLAYLVVHVGADKLVENAKTIGWGILLVIGLAGIAHVVKTWAWRLTAPGELNKVPFARTLGLRLASEALGQFGVAGQFLGDGARASLLGSEVETSSAISSVALDRGLFMICGVIVMIVGLLTLMFVPTAPHGLRICACVMTFVLLVLLFLSVQAIRRGWRFLSGTARFVGRMPWLKAWLQRKESVILSAEQQLLKFHTRAPGAFWMSVVLNLVAHGLAIAEVYLILLLMGSRVSLFGALMLESLTKLINAIGGLIPGSLGAYEGGNMAIVKLVGLSASGGLTLGLCRRFRAIVWAIIGGICLLYFSRSKRIAQAHENPGNESELNMSPEKVTLSNEHSLVCQKAAVILASQPASGSELSNSVLAEVGALPLVLRAILSAKSAGADRVIVVVNPANAPAIRSTLAKTRRLPDSVEWIEAAPESAIPMAVGQVAATAERVVLMAGDRSYHPSLYRVVNEWKPEGGALELTSADKPIGMTVLSHELVEDILKTGASLIQNMDDLHGRILSCQVIGPNGTAVETQTVADDLWQEVRTEENRVAAELKLDRWLVKPTDGIFARMNRRVSIPISHQLIKFPITPNMVSLFTLGVSFLSGLYFAFGGYWNTVIGAALSLWASILDGCDGEVARIKLQSSDFGCWLDTACDYLYYLFIFAGMTIGLARSSGRTSFVAWGVALFAGAILTFILAGLGRKQLSGERPEQYLAVWQKKAESHLRNPLIYIGRYTEFIVRRCFLPYALLVLALLNCLPLTLRLAAIGANIAWIISLRSHIAFSAKRRDTAPVSRSSSTATEPLTA